MEDHKLAEINVTLIGEVDLVVAEREAVRQDKAAVEQMKVDVQAMTDTTRDALTEAVNARDEVVADSGSTTAAMMTMTAATTAAMANLVARLNKEADQ